jgi:putative DNA primase/helicase
MGARHPKRTDAALAIWQPAITADGSLVETYLASRGLHVPPPPTLRFHADPKRPSGGIWPAMVGLVTRGSDETPLAIHRTFLACNGGGKAPVDPQKMMLGPCRGGAVRLGLPGDVLMVGEGVETCLAAIRATGHPAWAALSTSGLRGRRAQRDRAG